MGDRAVITTEKALKEGGIGIYIHWNGAQEYIESYLTYCEMQGFRTVEEDPYYGMARLCQVIANTFDSGLSVGIGPVEHIRHSADFDNGVWLIEGWRIVKQVVGDEVREVTDRGGRYGMIRGINFCQPGGIQFSSERLIEKVSEYERNHGVRIVN